MPFDLRLLSGDIVVDPFDLQLNEQGLEAVAQRLLITLKTFRGEYFLNTEFGAPWYQTILRKNVSKGLIDTQLREVIAAVPGVLQIVEYQSTIQAAIRQLNVTFRVRVDEGTIDVVIDVGNDNPSFSLFLRFTEDPGSVVRITEDGIAREVEQAP